jgi:hypothetical protein
MSKPKSGDYLVLQKGTGLIQTVTPKSVEFISDYGSRRDPESMPVAMITPIGSRAWRIKDRLVQFIVSPVFHAGNHELVTAKTIADAGARYKRALGLRLLRISENATLSSLEWAKVNIAASRELTNLAQTEDPSKWLSIKILGYK